MTQKQITIYTSDLSGEEIEGGETVTYALDGITYEIDLSDKEAADMRQALSTYVTASRRLARNGKPYTRTTVPQTKRKG